jgi:hypothetical protein
MNGTIAEYAPGAIKRLKLRGVDEPGFKIIRLPVFSLILNISLNGDLK